MQSQRDPDQRSSNPTRLFILSATLAVLISTITAATSSRLEYLDLLYFLTYIKLAISLVKLLPQAWLNYQRKSTIGWSIENIIMDMSGGVLSLMQLVLDAWRTDDWSSVTGNPGKL